MPVAAALAMLTVCVAASATTPEPIEMAFVAVERPRVIAPVWAVPPMTTAPAAAGTTVIAVAPLPP